MKTVLSFFVIFSILGSCKTRQAGLSHTEKATPIDTNTVYYTADIDATYKNGMIDVMRYIQRHFIYPKNQDTIQTDFLLTFVINTQGSVTDALINDNRQKDQYSVFDKEMLRVVTGMPKWKPAKQAGVVVKQYFILPIQLKLSNSGISGVNIR